MVVIMSSRDSRSSSRASAPFRMQDLGMGPITASEALAALCRLAAPQTPSPPIPEADRCASEPSSEAEDSLRAGASTPKAKPVKTSARSAVPVKTETREQEQGVNTAKWHCRICLQDPCAAPMAAMCGHIFCTR